MNLRRLSNRLTLTPLLLLLSTSVPNIAFALPADSFGAGDFGSCQFGSCSITISTAGSSGCSGAVCLPLSPNANGACTVNSDTVNVQTYASSGYSLLLGNANVGTALTNGSSTIPATSGTLASPVSLTANTWGYRVDGVGGFGAGPTAAVTNVSIASINSLAFAKTESSNNAQDNIAIVNNATSSSGDNYSVWYGICANTTASYGTYTSQVTYTAVAN